MLERLHRPRSGRASVPAWGLVAYLLCVTAGCGSTYFERSTAVDLLDPSQARAPDPLVVLSTTGVGPRVVHMFPSVPVRFLNEDSVPHTVTDAPDLGYGECPDVRRVGTVEAGQAISVAIERYGVCAFRDLTQPQNPAYQGLLVVH
jgi:hypothetical protein